MKKHLIFISFICLLFSPIKADEGFWLPQLDSIKYAELKSMGLKLDGEDIYDDTGQSGLSNAVISFNGACSGAIVSPEGLLLTNFHCCSDEIMKHIFKSEEDKSRDTFLAQSKDKEVYIPNLYIKTLLYIKDVTNDIIGQNNESDGQIIDKKIKEYIQNIGNENSSYEYVIKPILEGNKYILYAYQKFTDIRAVFIPPLSIGRFGGDSLNWEWPRYNSDFAIFRIYVDSNNRTANYSIDNIPYVPSKFIPISSDGFSENDLAIVLGYPASGNPFETSDFVSLMIGQSYPLRSHLYLMRINMANAMIKNNSSLESSYKSLINGLSNKKKMWDLMISEIGINGVEKIKAKEQSILQKIKSDSIRVETAKIQNQLNNTYDQMRIYSNAYDVYRDGLKNINVLSICTQINSLLKQSNGSLEPIAFLKALDKISLFYKNFDQSVDQNYFIEIMKLYRDVVSKDLQINSLLNNESNISSWAEWLYANSIFANSDNLIYKLKNTPETIANDPIVLLVNEIEETYNNKVWPFLPQLSEKSKILKKEYLKNILYTDPEASFSINGDGNIRLSFGKIKGYWDKGKYLNYQTYLGELLAEYKKSSHRDTTIAQIENIDIGLEKSSLPACFITSSQTSSGNSGSPVVNEKGELIGLNFDRNRNGTISDLYYDESTFRNIVVDIRYILFILEKIADAKQLTDELIRK
jgi:hypothetical protein